MADKSFHLTIDCATGLPLRDENPPSTFVRCSLQTAHHQRFSTPIQPSTVNPVYNYKQIICPYTEVLIFEILDSQGPLGLGKRFFTGAFTNLKRDAVLILKLSATT